MTVYVVDMRHEFTAEPKYAVAKSLEEAAVQAQDFFEAYEFEIRDGKPFDSGNDDGAEGGFACFDNVKMRDGKMLEFMHCGGQGPVCRVTEAAYVPTEWRSP